MVCISLVAISNSVAITGPTPGTETINANNRAGGPVFQTRVGLNEFMNLSFDQFLFLFDRAAGAGL